MTTTLDIEARDLKPGDLIRTRAGNRVVADTDQDTMLNPSGRGYGVALVAWLEPMLGMADVELFSPSDSVCVGRDA